MAEEQIKDIAIRDDVGITQEPELVLEEAHKAAQSLKRVVDAKPRKVIINNAQYLEFEDWQTLGRFYGISARVVSSHYIEVGTAKGFEAIADAIHTATGKVVSSAQSMCLNDELTWKDKPLFQLRSMAQTRACAKSLRNCLAWVVVLAGYQPTPAEEMLGSQTEKGQYWCPEHQTPWFKKGKMTSYAHPTEGGGWCYMKRKTLQPDAEVEQATEAKPQAQLVQTQRAQFEEHRKRREVSVQEVKGILQVDSLNEWIAQGHNLQEARDAIDAFVEAKEMAQLVKTQQGELSEVDENSVE